METLVKDDNDVLGYVVGWSRGDGRVRKLGFMTSWFLLWVAEGGSWEEENGESEREGERGGGGGGEGEGEE